MNAPRGGAPGGTPARGVSLRSLIVPVYTPAVLYGVGQGAIQPIIVHSAMDLGASVAFAGFVVGLVGVGQIMADLPVGSLVNRIGEKRSMLLAVGLDVIALLTCIFAQQLWLLCIAITCTGASGAVWSLARQTFVAESVPIHLRARAMSTLGGSQRIGAFIGPFLSASLIVLIGVAAGYWIHLVASLLAGVALLLAPALPGEDQRGLDRRSRRKAGRAAAKAGAGEGESEEAAEHRPVGVFEMISRYRKLLMTLGICIMLVSAVRASRQVALPLWASHIGLDAQHTALLFGISGAVDMLLFYPAGKVMDKYGRVWIAVPSVVVLAVAHLLMPLSHSFTSLMLIGLVLGLGNGIGSGIVMTLGADVSPQRDRAAFLGSWRLLADSGNAWGPLLLAGIAALAGLASGVLAMGGVGLFAGFLLSRWIPKYAPVHGARVRGQGPPIGTSGADSVS